MSKERLEEIAYNVGISLDGEKALMSSDDYDFLYNYAKEQAERVLELNNLLNKEVEKGYKMEGKIHDFIEQNKRYRATINAMGQILKDAIHALDVGEKVQGLEYGVAMRDEALEGDLE